MKVIATKTGFDGKRLRQPGEEFDMPTGAKASWFSPVKGAKDDKGEGQKPAPEAAKAGDALV